MYQNLVVSPLFLKEFSLLDSEKAYAVMSYLVTETFLCDRNNQLLKEYDKLREQNKDNPKILLFIENFIKSLTIGGRIKSITSISAKDRKESEWKEYQLEKLIASFDYWKIILSDYSNIEKQNNLGSEPEFSDVNNYMSPAEKSRIRTPQRISKSPGEEFDFRSWIKKFIFDAKKIIIQDGYACAKNEFRDTKFIIASLPVGSKIKIITLSDSARNNSRQNRSNDGIIVEEILQTLKNNNQNKSIEWDIVDEKKMLEDRHIQTEKFFIDLGHALGSTYKDKKTGRIICKKQFTITVSKL